MSAKVLVAGAAGSLGCHVTRELLERGYTVRALIRKTSLPGDLGACVESVQGDALDAAQLSGALEGVEIVFSCLGASILPDRARGRRSFGAVDTPANLNLLAEAERAGVSRFVYVSVAGQEELGHLAYVAAHEAVVRTLQASPVPAAVVRPSGLYSAFDEVLRMAARGVVPLMGDGSARTNPIHDLDLAAVCADAVEGGHEDIVAGGPHVLSRRGIIELAFEALGKRARVRPVPARLVRALGALSRPFHPRMADLMAFYATVATQDLIVPRVGARSLGDYFRQEAVRFRG